MASTLRAPRWPMLRNAGKFPNCLLAPDGFHLQRLTDRHMNLKPLRVCQCLFHLLIRANQCNLRSSITGIQFHHLLCHILSVTSGRNWPSRPQEEVFKCVGTLHSRVLRLQIKGKHLLTVINQQANTRVMENVRISDSCVYNTTGTLRTAIQAPLCKSELLPLHIEQQKCLL